MSSVTYSWTDAWQHGVFFLSNGRLRSGKLEVDLVRFQTAIWKMRLCSSPLGEKRSQARGPRPASEIKRTTGRTREKATAFSSFSRNHCQKWLTHTHPLSSIEWWKAQFVWTPCELTLLRFVNNIERVRAGVGGSRGGGGETQIRCLYPNNIAMIVDLKYFPRSTSISTPPGWDTSPLQGYPQY